MPSQAAASGRIAGFWTRLLAQLIDLCGWAFAATLVGLPLVYLAPGTFGLASAFPQSQDCTDLSATYVVGPDLRPVDAFDLDSILSLAYLAYVVTAQGLYGATVGKRLLRLRVVDRYGVRPGLGAAAIRNLVLNGPILVGLALYALMEWTSFGSLTLLLWLAAVLALCNLAIAVEVWLTARKGKPSLHDRLAGTRVVRLPRPAD